MQHIDDLLAENGTDAAAIGAQHGLSADQTKQAMASLMPFVMGGFQKKADAGAHDEVANLVGSDLVGEPSAATGNGILGSIFGSKDVSRHVAQHAGGQSGLPAGAMKALLPIVAAMVGKHLMSRGGAGGSGGMAGGLGGAILGSVLSGLGGNGQQLPGGGMAPVGGAASPGGGIGGALGGMLDRNGNGNPLDDILGGLMGGRR